jgi:hypothetical protein
MRMNVLIKEEKGVVKSKHAAGLVPTRHTIRPHEPSVAQPFAT